MSDHTRPTDKPYGPSVESSDDGGTWMTKGELARVRRISVASADRLIRRQGWRRQPGNDGRVRVLVPSDWQSPERNALRTDPTDRPTDGVSADPTDRGANPTDTGLLARGLAALEDAVAGLREQLSGAGERPSRYGTPASRRSAGTDRRAERRDGDDARRGRPDAGG